MISLPLRPILCLALLCALPGASLPAHGGIAKYSERGKIDFDTAMNLLKPYGTWAQVDGLWAYTPADHQTPYTHGRWLYTEYGWYWKGDLPYSWATEHYGYWKCGADHLWSWYPGPLWLPQIVELRATPTHIGWRCAPVDSDGQFTESADERYSHPDQWTFVTRAQFAGPITPQIAAPPSQVENLLDDSTDCMHTYVTYRPIDRPGPHPADFLALSRNGSGMFPPHVYFPSSDPKPAQPNPAPAAGTTMAPVTASAVTTSPVSSAAAPSPAAAAKKAVAATTPALPTFSDAAGDDGTGDGGKLDTRQVPYWTTMSLPAFTTERPDDAEPGQVFVYRPDFYQDQDGIERRIGLWMNPNAKSSLGIRLREVLAAEKPASNAPSSSSTPQPAGTPAVPVSSQDSAFSSPFEDSFPGGHDASGARASNASSKAAPTGLANSSAGP